jgi:hypothetical protein
MTLPIPLEDGTTHINIYTRGQTTLGRWLSNLANVKVTINNVTFRSLENYWFWLQANEEAKPFLVSCPPFDAKNYFKHHPEHRIPQDPSFEENIKQAMKHKLHQHPDMAKVFAASTLPFAHYYQYGGKPVPAGYDWIVEHWEETRSNPKFQAWVNSYQ